MTPRQLGLAGVILALAGGLGACYTDRLVAPPEVESRPQLADAGSLIGRVTSADSRAPLSGANALLMAADGSVVQSVSSDASGSFAFEAVPPGTYRVRVRAIGYVPNLSTPQAIDARTTALPGVALRKDSTILNCGLVIVGTRSVGAKRRESASAPSSTVPMDEAPARARRPPPISPRS